MSGEFAPFCCPINPTSTASDRAWGRKKPLERLTRSVKEVTVPVQSFVIEESLLFTKTPTPYLYPGDVCGLCKRQGEAGVHASAWHSLAPCRAEISVSCTVWIVPKCSVHQGGTCRDGAGLNMARPCSLSVVQFIHRTILVGLVRQGVAGEGHEKHHAEQDIVSVAWSVSILVWAGRCVEVSRGLPCCDGLLMTLASESRGGVPCAGLLGRSMHSVGCLCVFYCSFERNNIG